MVGLTGHGAREERAGTLLRVFGRVQGVGFRAFVRARARALGVAGWTCNLPDGSVAVAMAAQPEREAAFRRALGAGPPGAAVSRVEEVGPVTVDPGRPFEIASRPSGPAAEFLRREP